MYNFQATLHARPRATMPGGSIPQSGHDYPTLVMSQQALATAFALSFEEATRALAQLPRMFIEPDGSFVWVSAGGEPAWQVDGVLYDRDGRLLLVDLKGSCPAAALDQILSSVGWPATPVMFQLMRQGVFVDEETFRAIAERAPG